MGKELNITDDFVNRHPFPGPGLGIRILGEINHQKNVKILKEADYIFLKLIKEHGLYEKIWQSLLYLIANSNGWRNGRWKNLRKKFVF